MEPGALCARLLPGLLAAFATWRDLLSGVRVWRRSSRSLMPAGSWSGDGMMIEGSERMAAACLVLGEGPHAARVSGSREMNTPGGAPGPPGRRGRGNKRSRFSGGAERQPVKVARKCACLARVCLAAGECGASSLSALPAAWHVPAMCALGDRFQTASGSSAASVHLCGNSVFPSCQRRKAQRGLATPQVGPAQCRVRVAVACCVEWPHPDPRSSGSAAP